MISVTALKNTFFEPFDGPAIVDAKFLKWKSDPSSKYHDIINEVLQSSDDALCKKAILKLWMFKGNRSVYRGKVLHKLIENCLNQLPEHVNKQIIDEAETATSAARVCGGSNDSVFSELVDAEDCAAARKFIVSFMGGGMGGVKETPPYVCVRNEYFAFSQWMKRHSDTVRLYKAEWKIRSEKLNLVGVVDAVFEYIDSPGELLIVDWKRNAKIDMENPVEKMGLRAPFDVLPDCNFGHYSMQLNVYARMIESLPDVNLKVRKMLIVQIAGSSGIANEFNVKRLF